MLDSLGEAQRYVCDYGYTAVFWAYSRELRPADARRILMIAGALLASGGHLNIYWSCWCVGIATTAGGNIGYVIGKRGRPAAGAALRSPRSHQARAHRAGRRLFERHGGAVVLFARFVVVLRQLNGIVAGTMGMNWWRSSICNARRRGALGRVWAGLTLLPRPPLPRDPVGAAPAHEPCDSRYSQAAAIVQAARHSRLARTCATANAAQSRRNRQRRPQRGGFSLALRDTRGSDDRRHAAARIRGTANHPAKVARGPADTPAAAGAPWGKEFRLAG